LLNFDHDKSNHSAMKKSVENYTRSLSPFILLPVILFFFACQQNPQPETAATVKEDNKSQPAAKSSRKDLTSGKGSLSFKLDGQFYQTDPLHTKCWSTSSIPLAMLMARGDGLSISWQMGYTADQQSYKLDGDKKGTINFTIGKKTYWTRSVMGDNYLNIQVTEIKDKYSVLLLSGTFEGVLEDKEGNKVQITEGRFVTEDI
jgi:hypothetical protein